MDKVFGITCGGGRRSEKVVGLVSALCPNRCEGVIEVSLF